MVPVSNRHVSSRVKKAIAARRLLPDDNLVERELSEIFYFGRGVVRQSPQNLAASGLVTIERNRGAIVRRPS